MFFNFKKQTWRPAPGNADSARKRLRQRETFFGVMDRRTAMSLSWRPAAANNTMRDRSTTRNGSERLRTWDSNTVRCSGLNLMTGAMRIRNRLLTSLGCARIDKGYYL